MASLLWSMGPRHHDWRRAFYLIAGIGPARLCRFCSPAPRRASPAADSRATRAGRKAINGMYFGADGIRILGLWDSDADKLASIRPRASSLWRNWGLQSSFLQSRRATFTWSLSGM